VDEDLQRRLETQRELLARARRLRPGASVPYLAHLRVEVGGRTRDVLLAEAALPGSTPPIVDWETAPLAGVFFECAEGDAYEIEAGERLVEGTVLEKNLVGIEGGAIRTVVTPQSIVEGTRTTPRVPVLDPGDQARRPRSPADVELDAIQQAIVDLPPGTPVLVLGEAGSGKTTVALRRVARLAHGLGRRRRSAVIVPTDGLRRRAERVLARLGCEDVEVTTFEAFVLKQARRAFTGLPRALSGDAPAAVLRVKRDPALRVALRRLAAARRPRRRALADREDLEHLFGDSALLAEIAAASHVPLPPTQRADVLRHTHVQFSERSETELAGVDEDRLQTVDGSSLDEGTPLSDAGSIDVEDHAVLFELDRLRAEHLRRPATEPRPYDLLFVDEAQELAPLELRLLGRSLAPRGTLLVAGDANQQVDAGAFFGGWPATLEELQIPRAQVVTLARPYRCPPAVNELARHVIDPSAPPPVPDPSVRFVRTTSELHLVSWLVDEVRRVQQTRGPSRVGVITPGPAAARRLARLLGRGIEAHASIEEEATAAGVVVLSVLEAKGLELDCVIVSEASPAAYPGADAARRALYVAVTRAAHQLVLTTSSRWSPVIAAIAERQEIVG
jgi:DNA helicase-2/ATP-dependent DNA helicase PcrA